MSAVYVLIKKSIFAHDVAVRVIGVYDTKELAKEASAELAKKRHWGHTRIDIVARTIVKRSEEERQAKKIAKEALKPEIEKQKQAEKEKKERCRQAALNGEMENV